MLCWARHWDGAALRTSCAPGPDVFSHCASRALLTRPGQAGKLSAERPQHDVVLYGWVRSKHSQHPVGHDLRFKAQTLEEGFGSTLTILWQLDVLLSC